MFLLTYSPSVVDVIVPLIKSVLLNSRTCLSNIAKEINLCVTLKREVKVIQNTKFWQKHNLRITKYVHLKIAN